MAPRGSQAVLRRLTALAVLTGLTAVGAAAGERSAMPVVLSPGSIDAIPVIANHCPTFSWGGVPGGRDYELIVHRVDEEGAERRTVLSQSVPGSARSWTPDLDRCLERGGRYAWSVRAAGREGPSEGSPAARFEVAQLDVGEALAVVERYLAGRRLAGEAVAVAGVAARAPTETAAVPIPPADPFASGQSGLVVQGDTCCDGNLPTAYATWLANVSNDSHPDVLALEVPAQTDPAANVNYIGFFDWDDSEGKPRLIGEIEGDGTGGLHFTGSAAISWAYAKSGNTAGCAPTVMTCGSVVFCNPGDHVLGGGFRLTDWQSVDFVLLDAYTTGLAWVVNLVPGPSADFTFEAVAVCASAGS